MATLSNNPHHDAVNWDRTYREDGLLRVEVVCPHCRKPRWDRAGDVRRRIKLGTYGGQCYKDRLVFKARADRRERPAHPAVDWTDLKLAFVDGGNRRHTKVGVTCPKCGIKRWASPGPIAAKLRSENARGFTGECLGCSKNARKRDWVVLGPGRKIEPSKGYIRLTAEAISEDDRALYDAMRGRVTYLMEHRLVMAKTLGRPLLSNELVDHQDGVKTNNEPSNLRLYRRGRNEPGETTGYGTFYHEWQLALARIAQLEALVG